MGYPSAANLFINAKYHWLTFMLAGFKPKATINGHELQLNWGDNAIPAPPGRHTISMWVPYLWRFGKAEITVDNAAGPPPPVYYAAPVWTWMRGAIGVQPQKPPGLTGAWIFYGLVLVGLLACCGFVIVSGGN